MGLTMPGIRIKLPLKFNDTTLPVLLDDPVLAAGSLALVEMADLTKTPEAGDTLYLPNIAAERALALLPAGTTTADVRPTFRVTNTLAPAHGKFERTPKGGLHGVFTKTNGIAGQGAQLRLPRKLRDYIAANPTHELGLWVWMKTTRVATAASNGSGQHQQLNIGRAMGGSSADDFPARNDQTAVRMLRYGPAWATFNPANVAGHYTLDAGSPGTVDLVTRVATAVKGGYSMSSGAAPANGGELTATLNYGTIGGNSNHEPTHVNTAPSWVLYRMYVEDLTVSARTAADVNAIDLAAFNSAFGTGGRYNGDSNTAPATLVP